MKRRLIAIITIAAMLITMFPTGIFAADESSELTGTRAGENTYTITDIENFKSTIEDIKTSRDTEGLTSATLIFTEDLDFSSTDNESSSNFTAVGHNYFSGIDGVTLTLKSENDPVTLKNLGSTFGYTRLTNAGFNTNDFDARFFTGPMVLDNVKLSTQHRDVFFAQGYPLTITENFQSTSRISLVGGCLGTIKRVDGVGFPDRTGIGGGYEELNKTNKYPSTTHLEIHGGDYRFIYGGGYNSDIGSLEGDLDSQGTYVKIQLDNINSVDSSWYDVSQVFGGSAINQGSSRPSSATSGQIAGDTTVEIVSGSFGDIYAGSSNGSSSKRNGLILGDTHVTVGTEDGEAVNVNEIFGGSSNSTIGDDDVRLEANGYKPVKIGGDTYVTVNASTVGRDSDGNIHDAGDYDIVEGTTHVTLNGGSNFDWVFAGGMNSNYREKAEINNMREEEQAATITINGGEWNEIYSGVHTFVGSSQANSEQPIAGDVFVQMNGGTVNYFSLSSPMTKVDGNSILEINGGTLGNLSTDISGYRYTTYSGNKLNYGQVTGERIVNLKNANQMECWQIYAIDDINVDNTAPFIARGKQGGALQSCGSMNIQKGTLALTGTNTISGDFTIAENGVLALNGTSSVITTPGSLNAQGSANGTGKLLVIDASASTADGWISTNMNEVTPTVGDVYLRAKTTNETASAESDANLLDLQNTEAVKKGLYVEYTKDPTATTTSYDHAWRIAQGTPPAPEEYHVLYSFKCGTKGASLPEAVTKLLPIDSKTYALGDTVTATQPKQLSVEGPKSNSDDTPGVWTFKGYDADSKVVSNDILETGFDGSKYIQFEGTWVWEKKAEEVTVTFDHNDGTGQTEPVTVEKDSTVGDDMPAEPTRDGFTFTGWNTKQDGSGTEFKADTEVTENIIVYAQWECEKSIAVKPADITIYRGGEEGHDGVVNVNKETGEVEVVSSDSLPEPGFLVTLPESLKDKNVTTLTFKEKDGDRTWTFKSYDGKSTEVYRLVPADGQTATRVTFTDGGGNTVVSDEFDVGAAVNTTFTMALYKGEGATAVGDIVVKDGGTTYPVDSNATGTLTVRGTTDQAQLATVKTAITPEKGKAAVEAVADTTYSINGGDVEVADPDGVALLYDAIIDHSGENRTALLQKRAESYLAEKEQAPADGNKYAYSFQYMDLVDANNGNAWVKASNAVTVYWPLPEGTTKDTKFTLLHFKDLDRDMSSNQVADKIASSELETLKIKEVTDSHVVFEVQPGEFSPFALVREEQTTTPAPTEVTVTFKPGDHGDLIGADADGNVSATVASGDKLTDAQIPDVDADHGYYFTGWLGSDGKTYSDEDLLELTITSDMTFTAQYEKKHIPTPPPVGPGDDDDDGDDNEPPILNTQDHCSYVVGYAEDYRTGQPTDNEDLWPVKPQNNITRAEVASIFYRLLKEDVRDENTTDVSNFSDVSSSDWYGTTVATLADMGIVKGYEDGTFRPNAPITRAEFAAIATRFFEETGATYEPGTFTDVTGDEWFAGAIMDAVNLGLIGGYEDGTVRPNNNITRAEACAIVNRTLGRVPDADHLLPEDVMKTWPDNPESAWFYADMQEATNGHEYEWITEDGNKVENWIDLLDKDWNDRSVN